MADVIDQAQAFDALNLAQSLEVQAAIARHAPKFSPVGYCLNPHCGEEFEPNSPRLYCGPPCAEQHHRRIYPR
jgi:hypothetical protein